MLSFSEKLEVEKPLIAQNIVKTRRTSVITFTYFYIIVSTNSVKNFNSIITGIKENSVYYNSFYSLKKYRNPFYFYFLGNITILELKDSYFETNINSKVYRQAYNTHKELENKIYKLYLNEMNNWYKNNESYINEKISILGITKVPITLKKTKTFLGRCTYDRINKTYSIQINPYILKFREEVVKYVFLHEYCHVIYQDHKSGFKNAMSILVPDFKNIEREIKINKYLMNCQIEDIDYNYIKGV